MILKDRLKKYLPHKPYCSNDKTASLIRNQYHALLHTYIQINAPTVWAWLVFDIDKPFQGVWCWETNNLPAANYIAMNKEKGTYHAVYAISPVFTGENARLRPIAYLTAIQRTYNVLMGADESYAHLMTRNPLDNKTWKVTVFHQHQYDLAELADYVDRLLPRQAGAVLTGLNRNVELFDELRHYAYANIKTAVNQNVWFDLLFSKAESINEQFKNKMDFSEVKGIAKSVSKWTWNRRDTIRVKERKMDLNLEQPLEIRQSVGAFYSHDVRKVGTLARISKAVETLKANGTKVTQKAITDQSGVSKNTLTKYKDFIKSIK